jgi:hypothetical protein
VREGRNGHIPDLAIELAAADLQRLIRDPAHEGRLLLNQSRIRIEGNSSLLRSLADLLL